MASPIFGKDRGRGDSVAQQRAKIPVYESYAGTGDHTENIPVLCRELLVSKDTSAGTLSVQVLGPENLNVTFILKGEEVLDERLAEFDTVIITGPGIDWRMWTRSAQVA